MARDPLLLSSGRRGSITLVALCMTTVLGIALGSYLTLCFRSNQFSVRSLHLERARELAQVGLEEALWALNQNTWTSSGPGGDTAWTTTGANRTVTLAFPLEGQSASGSVALTVANYASTGPTWPTLTAAATLTLTGGATFTKTLQATTGPAPVFGNAITSTESYVSFAQGGTVDSWNSDPDNNPATSAAVYATTAGAPANYAAVVAGKGDGTYGVVLNQAEIRGYVATVGQPVSYSTSGSPPGKVLGPTTAAGVNVDVTRIGKSAFLPSPTVFTVTPPATSGSNYGGLLGLVDLVANVASTIGLNLFKTSDLWIDGSILKPSITVSRPMKIIVDGDLAIKTGTLGLSTGRIRIATTGSLELYVSGDITIEGDGFENLTKDPKKLVIYSTNPAATATITLNTTADFHGVIFSENKPIDVRRDLTIYGALLSRTYVRFTATNPVFHYDTSLRQTLFSGIKTPYVTRQVTEL